MRILTVLALLLAAALPLYAQQARFPEPEFEKPHPLPQTTQPSARSLAMEYVDLAALVAAMSLAA